MDVCETTGHDVKWADDLGLVASAGVRTLRYPIRWHRLEPEPGVFDWTETDLRFEWMAANGLRPIVDLVHHTSYPTWVGGFGDPRFASAYLRYCEAFANRYPSIEAYTLFNEPFATLFLCGHEGVWPPYGKTISDLVALYRNVLPALTRAARMFAEMLPDASHVYVDTCEGHSGTGVGASYATMANDRRFFLLDVITGRDISLARPFVRQVVAAGGGDLLEIEPGPIDVLGLDYYAHSEWWFEDDRGVAPSPRPVGLAALIGEYHERYPHLELMLSETNIRGFASDRATWLKYTLEQCEKAKKAGAPIGAYCWFPFIDSTDWDSLLARPNGHVDPVGVYWLDDRLERRASSMSSSYALVAAGSSSADLPAYRFQPPVDAWVAGLLPQMATWSWQDPPSDEVGPFRSRPRSIAKEGVLDGSAA